MFCKQGGTGFAVLIVRIESVWQQECCRMSFPLIASTSFDDDTMCETVFYKHPFMDVMFRFYGFRRVLLLSLSPVADFYVDAFLDLLSVMESMADLFDCVVFCHTRVGATRIAVSIWGAKPSTELSRQC